MPLRVNMFCPSFSSVKEKECVKGKLSFIKFIFGVLVQLNVCRLLLLLLPML